MAVQAVMNTIDAASRVEDLQAELQATQAERDRYREALERIDEMAPCLHGLGNARLVARDALYGELCPSHDS